MLNNNINILLKRILKKKAKMSPFCPTQNKNLVVCPSDPGAYHIGYKPDSLSRARVPIPTTFAACHSLSPSRFLPLYTSGSNFLAGDPKEKESVCPGTKLVITASSENSPSSSSQHSCTGLFPLVLKHLFSNLSKFLDFSFTPLRNYCFYIMFIYDVLK